eukprot:GHRQ01034187.1.p2 GENE.GHRQ01034187.1~~GHRQ01034187.1.p2  ORF type:complete len:102 (+),score=17.65 GHRQ01034187.1:270-575(+)
MLVVRYVGSVKILLIAGKIVLVLAEQMQQASALQGHCLQADLGAALQDMHRTQRMWRWVLRLLLQKQSRWCSNAASLVHASIQADYADAALTEARQGVRRR